MSLSEVLSDISHGITVYDEKIEKYSKLLNYTADCSELEVEYIKYAIKLEQVQKLIFQSALKDNNSILFPKLLSKCDEIIGDIIDISSQRVKLGEENEGQHLRTCNNYLKRRGYIKSLCEFASNKNK